MGGGLTPPPPPPGNVGNSIKREENIKYWEKIYLFNFFNISKIHKKLKQHSINIKNYTAHPHDMVHIPAKFRENTSMRFLVTVRKLNVTDGQTDAGVAQILNVGNSIKYEENMKYWKQIFNLFSSIFQKFITNSNNIPSISKTIQHTPLTWCTFLQSFENTSMRFWVTVRKLNVTDGRIDRQTGSLARSPVLGLRCGGR